MEKWVLSLRHSPLGCLLGCLVALFGVVLPTLALAVESHGHPCRDMFFDPLPNLFSVLQVAMLPVVMGILLVGCGEPSSSSGWVRCWPPAPATRYSLPPWFPRV